MNEKIAVAVVVDAETAEKIAKEVKRETLRDELTAILDRMKQEGFRLAISDHPEKCDPFFTNTIVINTEYFNSRDRYSNYVNKR
jgi:hypothetical protein